MNRLFVFLFLSLFLIGFASAIKNSDFTIDQDKIDNLQTKTNYGKYILSEKSWYDPFGIWTEEEVAEYELKDNSDMCGENCYAIKEIELHKEASLIDAVKFETILEDGSRIEQPIRNYQFQLKTGEKQIEIDDYEYQCVGTGVFETTNGTELQTCSNVKIGSHFENEILWENYNPGELKEAGIYTLKLSGEKKPSRKVDWIIKSQGIWLDEWAIWGVPPATTSLDEFNYGPGSNNLDTSIWNPIHDEGGSNFHYNVNGSRLDFAPGYTSQGFRMDGWVDSNGSLSPNLKGKINVSIGILGLVLSGGLETGSGRLGISDNLNNYVEIYNVSSPFTTPELISFVANDISTVSLYIDGVYNSSQSLSTLTGDKWGVRIGGTSYDTNVAFYVDYVRYGISNTSIILNSPTDNYFSPTNLVTFNATTIVGEGATLVNMSLFHNASGNFVLNQTQIITGTFNTTTFDATFGNEETFIWGIQACDSDGDCGFSENRVVSIDTTSPTITINSPGTLVDYGKINSSITLNWSVTDTNPNSMWYNYNGTDQIVYGAENTTTFTIESYTNRNLTFYANDTAGNINSTFVDWDYKVFENSFNFTNVTSSGSIEAYVLNVTLAAGQDITSATLINGALNISSSIFSSGNERSLSIPSYIIPSYPISTEVSLSYFIQLADSTQITTTPINQTVNPVSIDDCSVFTNQILNISLLKERDQTALSGDMDVNLLLLNSFDFGLVSNLNLSVTSTQNLGEDIPERVVAES